MLDDNSVSFVNVTQILPFMYVFLLFLKCSCLCTDFDECQNSPCRHGGTCRNLEPSFECICPPEYQGPLCQNGNIVIPYQRDVYFGNTVLQYEFF